MWNMSNRTVRLSTGYQVKRQQEEGNSKDGKRKDVFVLNKYFEKADNANYKPSF
jgi:hypothetical protein